MRAEEGAGQASADTRVRQQDRRRPYGSAGSAAERELVRILLHRRQFVESVAERVGQDSFRDPLLAQIFMRLVVAPEDSVEAVVMTLDDEAVALLNELSENDGGLDVGDGLRGHRVMRCLGFGRRSAGDGGLHDRVVVGSERTVCQNAEM